MSASSCAVAPEGVTYHLAIDIGASSGRHVLGHMEQGRLVLEEMYRFDNLQLRKNGHDCWDKEGLYESILAGLEACAKAGKVPSTMGIDTWGVDFVLLDENDEVVGDAVAYRDARTQDIFPETDEMISPLEVYRRTGIQRQPFNTLYQFVALAKEAPEQLERAQRFLMIPEYFNFLLTGKKVNEYTNATTTNLLNARTKDWDEEILGACGIPARLFGKVEMPGFVLGGFTLEVQARVGFDCEVVLPATHDTGSAFLAVPARDDEAVYLSSGTWSLLGVEHEGPITADASRLQNFTNEGGYDYRFRFLKNIMGLWMIQSIRRELNGVDYVAGKVMGEEERQALECLGVEPGTREFGFVDLIEAAKAAEGFGACVNVNDDRFLAPDSMIAEIRSACRETGQSVPATVGQLMKCVYISLSTCYAESIADLQALTGMEYTSINIVGGGCQDMFLNQLTANACGLPVLAGPIEGTSLGNLMVQMLNAGTFATLQEARDCVRESFEIKVVEPAE